MSYVYSYLGGATVQKILHNLLLFFLTFALAFGTVISAHAQIDPQAVSFVETSLLDAQTMSWSNPVRDASLLQIGDGGAVSLRIRSINGLYGDVLYRTYAGATGWSNWAMNGKEVDQTQGPIEAVQIRLNGQIADNYSIYYSARLADGTTCGWAHDGSTTGTIATGNYATGLCVFLAQRGADTSSFSPENAVITPSVEGMYFTDGVLTYLDGSGQPFTGWQWVDRDRYYFVNGAAVTGWQYIDGYKYFFESDGRLVTDLEPYLHSTGPFEIRINKQMNCTTIYAKDGANGFIIPYKAFLCSTGDDTPIGTFRTPEKLRWQLMLSGVYCQYLTRLGPGLQILMHSAIYTRPDPYTLHPSTYNRMGIARSSGCIRYITSDCKWIYDNCALGTSVTVYNSPVPGPFDRPALKIVISSSQTWDPTDPNIPENGL